MRMDRRLLLGGAASLAASPVFAQNSPPRIRRSVSSLTATSDDVVAFGEGVRLMKRRSDALSWERQRILHATQARHGDSLFLPWHRLQLSHLERIISRLTGYPRFAIPYWDYQTTPFLPSWTTQPGARLYEPQRSPGANTRDYNQARWAADANRADRRTDSLSRFLGLPLAANQPRQAGSVESYGHNWIHTLVGGLMGQIETATLDPVFWMHHANVDRFWDAWHRDRRPAYPSWWTSRTLNGFIGETGTGTGTWTVGRILDTRSLGYGYDLAGPPVLFAMAPPPPRAGVRRLAGSEVFNLTAAVAPGQSSASLVLPEALLRAVTEAEGQDVEITSEGRVAYLADARLLNRSININARPRGARPVSLGSSTTFFHLAQGAHAAHAGDYAVGFDLDGVLGGLARAAQPVTITVEAEDLRPEANRAGPQVRELSLNVTLTRYVTR